MRVHRAVFWGCMTVPLLQAQKDWAGFNGDPGGRRYSTLTQINTRNVAKLKPAWQYGVDPSGIDFSSGEARAATGTEAVPVMAGGILYTPTRQHTIVAARARRPGRRSGNIVWAARARLSAESPIGGAIRIIPRRSSPEPWTAGCWR